MWKLCLILALLICGLFAASLDARCGGRGSGRMGFFHRRQSVRQGGCASGNCGGMSYSSQQSFQMRGGGFQFVPPQGMRTCGPGGCN